MHGMVGMILSVMTLARILIRSYEDHHHGREKPKLMQMVKHVWNWKVYRRRRSSKFGSEVYKRRRRSSKFQIKECMEVRCTKEGENQASFKWRSVWKWGVQKKEKIKQVSIKECIEEDKQEEDQATLELRSVYNNKKQTWGKRGGTWRMMSMMMKSIPNGDEVLRKGPWMPEEDEILVDYVRQFGARDWSSIRSKGLLPRTGKSCRLRWVNKLKPDLKRCFSPSLPIPPTTQKKRK